jgi:hypothetical protein
VAAEAVASKSMPMRMCVWELALVVVLGTRVVGRLASDVVAALSLPESQKALGTGSSPKKLDGGGAL